MSGMANVMPTEPRNGSFDVSWSSDNASANGNGEGLQGPAIGAHLALSARFR
jgi:hypothetical protein